MTFVCITGAYCCNCVIVALLGDSVVQRRYFTVRIGQSSLIVIFLVEFYAKTNYDEATVT